MSSLSRAMNSVLPRDEVQSPTSEVVAAPPTTPAPPDLAGSPKPEHGLDFSPRARSPSSTAPSAHHREADYTPESLHSTRSSQSRKSRRRKGGAKGAGGVPLLARLRPALVLENSGSVARDHLATERTFLAYVRTSLALATTGVGLVQLFTVAESSDPARINRVIGRLEKYAQPLGATLIIFGFVVLVAGLFRYFVIQDALTKGLFPVTRLTIVGITLILAAITIIVFSVLVSTRT